MSKGQLRYNSIWFLLLSWGMMAANRSFLAMRLFSEGQRAWLVLLLGFAALLLAALSLQSYRKAAPTGSNLGCIYLVVLLLTIIAGVLVLFFSLAYFFSYAAST